MNPNNWFTVFSLSLMSNQREAILLVQSTNNQTSPLPVFVTNPTVNISGWAAVIISFFTAVILLWSARLQFKSQRLKFINEINSDHFYIIYELKHQVEKNDFSARDYYRRYWNQRVREFNAWRDGVISDEMYSRWLRQEKLEHDNDVKVGELSYKEAYTEFRPSLEKVVDDELFKLMDELFESNAPDNATKVVKKRKKLKNNTFSSIW